MRTRASSARPAARLVGAIALTAAATMAVSAPAASSAPERPKPARELPALRGTEQSGVATKATTLSARYCFQPVNGVYRMYSYIPGIQPGQPVAVSASEWNDLTDTEFIGAASITVRNVTVTSGLVNSVVHLDWGSPIRVCLHYVW